MIQNLIERYSESFIGAMINGALDGLKVAGIVAALMIAFIGVMEVVNYVISAASGAMGHAVTLQQIFGYVLAPFAFLMGIPAQDIIPAGGIMGTKIVLNEFVAILDLKGVAATLSPRTVGIVTVFLISFASISQIGAIVGTIRALSENKEASFLNLVENVICINTCFYFICDNRWIVYLLKNTLLVEVRCFLSIVTFLIPYIFFKCYDEQWYVPTSLTAVGILNINM